MLATWRLYAYAAVFLVIGGVLWRLNYLSHKADRLEHANKYLVSSLKTERENTRKANEASQAYQSDLRRVESERSNVPVVRLCHGAPKLPAAPAPGRPDAAPEGHVSGAAAEDPVAGPDIGAELLEYGIACEANALQLDRLQRWVRGR